MFLMFSAFRVLHTCRHGTSKNEPKNYQKSIPKRTKTHLNTPSASTRKHRAKKHQKQASKHPKMDPQNPLKTGSGRLLDPPTGALGLQGWPDGPPDQHGANFSAQAWGSVHVTSTKLHACHEKLAPCWPPAPFFIDLCWF